MRYVHVNKKQKFPITNDEILPEILIGRAYDGEVCDDGHRKLAKVYGVLIQPNGKDGTFAVDEKAYEGAILKGRFIASREARLLRIENVRPGDAERHFNFSVRPAPERAQFDTSVPPGTKLS